MDPLLGEIRMFAGNFAPRGWALCQGQLLSIAQNTALFSILGTTYGGNGTSTFALPDLRGRTAMNWGQGPGLSLRTIGEIDGVENVTLLTTQMPAHVHTLAANSNGGSQTVPTNNFIAGPNDPSSGAVYPAFEKTSNTTMAPTSIGPTGGSQPHNNMQPTLTVSFIIALQGVFPSRD